jgi:GNAT superfamily N-acetyltransferase
VSTVSVRDAGTADATLYVKLFPELALDEPTPGPERVRELIRDMQIAEGDRGFVVATKEGEVGFVRQIVVAPGARRDGVGRALMAAAADRLRAHGVKEWRLNVKADNAAAIALYEALGMSVDFRSAALWIPRAVRFALPASPRPVVVAEPSDAELAELEVRFAIPTGQLARPWRGAVVRMARSPAPAPADARGMMRFSPSFPGAYPFFADDAPTARALLGAAFDLVPPECPRVGLVVERNELLVESLLTAGAELRFRMLQLSGVL